MHSSSKDKDGKPLPDLAMKWGISPGKHSEIEHPPEESFSPEEQKKRQKQREKGIDPDLKAHMDKITKGEGGFWTKVAGTSMGGGWIK